MADLENRRIRAIDLKTKTVRTVAGNGQRGAPTDGSDAVHAPLVDPRAVAIDRAGNLYILERGGHALRVVDRAGKIRTVVGTGKAGPFSDITDPLSVTLKGPKHLWIDRHDNVVIVDSENDVIRLFAPAEGKVIRIAGTGRRGGNLSRDPLQVQLAHPHGVYVDAQQRIYISDSNNGRVLRVD